MPRLFKTRFSARVPMACATAVALTFTGAVAGLEAPALPEFPLFALGEHDPELKNIIVLDTGGTITASAMTRISYLNYGGETGPANGVQTILEDMFPELEGVANLSVVNLAANDYNIGSSGGLTTEKLFVISRTIDMYLADPEVDGLVLTAGTNVLEEDAYFFDLTVQSPKPVVLTGSMHQYGTFTYDGYTNLFSSIRLAADGGTTCFGTVVLLNDQFFAARDVSKTDGFRMDTFDARLYGPLGVVNQDNVDIVRAPSRVQDCGTDAWATPFNLADMTPEALPTVDVIMSHVEASPSIIEGSVAGGAKGIVIAGHGPGGISNFQTEARDAALEAGVMIVSASRTGGQGNYDSGEGVIGSGDLQPLKSRILLQLSLAFADEAMTARDLFTTVGSAQFTPYVID